MSCWERRHWGHFAPSEGPCNDLTCRRKHCRAEQANTGAVMSSGEQGLVSWSLKLDASVPSLDLWMHLTEVCFYNQKEQACLGWHQRYPYKTQLLWQGCGLERKFKVASPYSHISLILPLHFLILIHICAAFPTFHIYQQHPLMLSENLCRSFFLRPGLWQRTSSKASLVLLNISFLHLPFLFPSKPWVFYFMLTSCWISTNLILSATPSPTATSQRFLSSIALSWCILIVNLMRVKPNISLL